MLEAANGKVGVALLAGLGWLASPTAAELGSLGSELWTADTPGVTQLDAETSADLGSALATGDFDCDDFADLAVGVPGHEVSGLAGAGGVLVLFGAEGGLTASGNQLWSQASPGLQGLEEAGDFFGQVLAAGDFDGDGCSDLAIGVWNEDIEDVNPVQTRAGAVHVLYGVAGVGLSSVGSVLFTASLTTPPGDSATDEFFGQALAAGDLDGDGFDDLAIGVPGAGTASNAPQIGRVELFYGSATGVHPDQSSQILTRDLVEVPGGPQFHERFGHALVFGRFTAERTWLAIGGPGRDDGAATGAGSVVLWRPFDGTPAEAMELLESQVAVPGVAEDGDFFGSALAAGDFDGDGLDDLAVGAQNEDVGAVVDAGAVMVLYLSGPSSSFVITQDDFPFNSAETSDNFGRVLAAADFDADGADDLVVGVPRENLGGDFAGIVHVVYGARGSGLDIERTQNWLQAIDPTEAGDAFGTALAAGRFAGHSGADLAIGVPGEDLPGALGSGAVNVNYTSSLFADGFETGDTGAWDIVVP